jgi:ribosomal protein S12 methylthiotransferase accessory factor
MSVATAAPEALLEAAWPTARACGVTRLARLTDLDRVGIPVWYAIRPNSRSLSQEGGKGLTDAVARLSATMESIERSHAEAARPSLFRASWRALHAAGEAAAAAQLPLARTSLFAPDVEQRWTWGSALGDGPPRRLAVPATLADVHPPLGADDPVTYQLGSTGLASGFRREDALVSGLYEAIERDAVTRWRMRGDRDPAAYRRVDPATIPWSDALGLLEAYDAAGVTALVFDCRVDTGVPVFLAYLVDRTQRWGGLCRGYGAHLDPGRALVQALVEAAQARVSVIAGARDDRFASDLARQRRGDSPARAARFLAVVPAVDAGELAAAAVDPGPPARQLGTLLERLAAAGIADVASLDLAPADSAVAVVRVVAFGLEGYRTWYHHPGPRARRSMEQP